jgi:ferredoxin-nitrate reductase
VEKYIKPKQKIIVIGAGAAASRFVSAYRELNGQDEIHVFSREVIPFYNRVMLPDYISGLMPWEKLIKLRREEHEKLNVHLHNGISVQSINREKKTVLDTEGNVQFYDILLLATGSSAALPKNLNTDMEGVFTMRTRQDADLLKAYTDIGSHVVIVGGGLLGLELAASLRELSRNVTIIQRVSQLMNRQLDNVASELLHEEMTDRGIDIYYNDQIKYLTGKDKIQGVRLASGRTIDCDALVFAIGTTPNIDLARQAGLQTNRGIVVNEYMQSSDPSIFAMGEIAEFQGAMYGITAAAEEQADVICKYLNGDWLNYYKGSLSMNILKMEGLNLCSIGMVEVPANGKGYEEVIFIDKSKRYYKKCIIHQDRLVGAILFGDKSEFIEFKELIANQTELSEKRLQLLRSGKAGGGGVVGKLICSCNNVGEGSIHKVVREGCTQLTDVCKATGAGMGCGSCKPEVKAILERSLAAV